MGISPQRLREPIRLIADGMARFDDKFNLIFKRKNFAAFGFVCGLDLLLKFLDSFAERIEDSGECFLGLLRKLGGVRFQNAICDVLKFRRQFLLQLVKLHNLRVDLLCEGALTLLEARNLGSGQFCLARRFIALGLKCAVLLSLFFDLFREARNSLGQARNVLPSPFCFGGGGSVIGTKLIGLGLKCGALLVEPGNFHLSFSQCIRVTSANGGPNISAKNDAKAGG